MSDFETPQHLTPENIVQLKQALTLAGMNVGNADDQMNPQFQDALQKVAAQAKVNLNDVDFNGPANSASQQFLAQLSQDIQQVQSHGQGRHIEKIGPDGKVSEVSEEEFERLKREGKLKKIGVAHNAQEEQELLNQINGSQQSPGAHEGASQGHHIENIGPEGNVSEVSEEEFERLKREGKLKKIGVAHNAQEEQELLNQINGSQQSPAAHEGASQGHHIEKIGPDGKVSEVSEEEFERLKREGKLRKLSPEEVREFEANHQSQTANVVPSVESKQGETGKTTNNGQEPHPFEALLAANGMSRAEVNYGGQEHGPEQHIYHGLSTGQPQIEKGAARSA